MSTPSHASAHWSPRAVVTFSSLSTPLVPYPSSPTHLLLLSAAPHPTSGTTIYFSLSLLPPHLFSSLRRLLNIPRPISSPPGLLPPPSLSPPPLPILSPPPAKGRWGWWTGQTTGQTAKWSNAGGAGGPGDQPAVQDALHPLPGARPPITIITIVVVIITIIILLIFVIIVIQLSMICKYSQPRRCHPLP